MRSSKSYVKQAFDLFPDTVEAGDLLVPCSFVVPYSNWRVTFTPAKGGTSTRRSLRSSCQRRCYRSTTSAASVLSAWRRASPTLFRECADTNHPIVPTVSTILFKYFGSALLASSSTLLSFLLLWNARDKWYLLSLPTTETSRETNLRNISLAV